METSKTLNLTLSIFFKAVLFIFFAVPGALAVFLGMFILCMTMLEKHSNKPYQFWLQGILGVCIGSVFVIVGLQKTKQWLYLLVFWSIPIVLLVPPIICGLLSNSMQSKYEGVVSILTFLAIFILPFTIKKQIDKFYQSRIKLNL